MDLKSLWNSTKTRMEPMMDMMHELTAISGEHTDPSGRVVYEGMPVLQDCFGESTEFYGYQTLLSRNETCVMGESCELEEFLISSDIEPEDESAEVELEAESLGSTNSAEQDDRIQARNSIDANERIHRTGQRRPSLLKNILSFFTNGARALYPHRPVGRNQGVNKRKGKPKGCRNSNMYQTQFDNLHHADPHQHHKQYTNPQQLYDSTSNSNFNIHHADPHQHHKHYTNPQQHYDSTSNSNFNTDDWEPVGQRRVKRQAERFASRGRPRCRAFQSRRCNNK